MAQSIARMRFETSPRPSGAGPRVSTAGLADPWRPVRQHCGGGCPLAPVALSHVQGLGLPIPNPADGSAPSGASGSAANVSFRLSPQPQGSRLPRRSLAGDAFRGNENKSLTAISNRKSNDSRKLATLSKSITSKFLIATKWHCSEEKAKREEKAKQKRPPTDDGSRPDAASAGPPGRPRDCPRD
jgi:hypothetical protein